MTSDTVVVTGAAGFIGRWVVHELLERGFTVHGMDDLRNGSRRNIAAFDTEDAFEFTTGSVTTRDDVETVLTEEVDFCIHLAAEIDVQESLDDPDSHFEANIVGTKHVLEFCRKNEIALGLVGTCMVYDMVESEAGIDESHPVKPASPYAGSKLAAENLAESYYHGYGLPVTIMRPFNTYGPFQKTGMAGGVVSIFTNRDIAGKPLTIYGDGTQTRDLLYVTDCAEFIIEATLSDETTGEILNAGTGTDISINELAELIASEDTEIEHVEHHHPQSEVEKLLCDPTKAHSMIDWEPTVSLTEGVSRLREWLKSHEEVPSR
jgi:Nucleoside-diphosphate-sugar epimerases